MTIEEFVRRHLEEHDKTSYTLEEVERLVIQYRQKQAAAAAFEGWKDASINELVGVEVKQ